MEEFLTQRRDNWEERLMTAEETWGKECIPRVRGRWKMYRQACDDSGWEIVKMELRLKYGPQRLMLSIEREDWKNDPQVHSWFFMP